MLSHIGALSGRGTRSLVTGHRRLPYALRTFQTSALCQDSIFSDIVIEEPEGEKTSSDKKAFATKTQLGCSMQKLKEVCSQIRGLRIEDAVRQLQVNPRKMSGEVLKAIKMARNNARFHGIPDENLVVTHTIINRNTPHKRVRPHAKGRRGIKLHRRSDLTVHLDDITKLQGKKWEYRRLREQVKQKFENAKKEEAVAE